jgi:hypothetical protein
VASGALLHRNSARACRGLVGVIALLALALTFTSLGLAADSRSGGGSGPSSAATRGTLSASGRCSRATARQVVDQLPDVNIFVLPDPVRQVLCGPFTGPGSNAMAVTIGAPTCWPIQNWAVFRFTAGDWQLVLNTPAYLVPPLVAVGSDIRETTGVHRSGDPRCFFNGGTRARIWHWDGTRLVAGARKQVKPANAPADAFTSGYFKTPSGNIQCDYGYRGGADVDAYVRCGIRSGLKPPPPSRGPGCDVPNRVVIRHTGRASLAGLSACPGEDEGDAGPFAGPGVARVLGYGKTWSGGGLSCMSAVTGLTCRNTSGHGFFLSRESWRQF